MDTLVSVGYVTKDLCIFWLGKHDRKVFGTKLTSLKRKLSVWHANESIFEAEFGVQNKDKVFGTTIQSLEPQ